MDVVSLMSAALGFAAAEVAKGVAGKAASDLYEAAKRVWRRAHGSELRPAELRFETMDALVEHSPELLGEIELVERETPVLRRLRLVQRAVNGARILWIDDNPSWNEWEVASLTAVGAIVHTAKSTQSAMESVGTGFDLIISDICRGDEQKAGVAALPGLRSAAPEVPIIFYVGELLNGPPSGAFGITNRPDELLHLVLDALERRRL